MNCSIVHLEPWGAGGLRAALRSDTLWGALCWAIRMIYGEAELEKILASYREKGADAFYLSSAFPYSEVGVEKNGEVQHKKTYFLPGPLLPSTLNDDSDPTLGGKATNPREIKLALRRRKANNKRLTYCSKSYFENLISRGKSSLPPSKPPEIIARATTHNTIDRLTNGTLTLNERGQLYHTNEIYLKIDKGKKEDKKIVNRTVGWYFLLKGNLEKVQGALRFLSHYGIGGDRSIGKGRFKISEISDFEIKTPADANARMSLSLYRPTEAELKQFLQGEQKKLMHYKLEDRLGRTQWGGIKQKPDKKAARGLQRFLHEDALLFFTEGSIVPLISEQEDLLGQNTVVGRHHLDFDIERYGYGFMIDVKIPEL